MNVDGSCICVSGIGNDDGNDSAGHVRVFRLQNDHDEWEQLGNDIDGTDYDGQLGYSLSMNGPGDVVAVGIPFSTDKMGKVHVYRLVNGMWTLFGEEIVGNIRGDRFGYSIALDHDGTYVVVGSIGVDV